MAAPSPNPIDAPAHILALLDTLHATSLAQEAAIASPNSNGKVFSSDIVRDLNNNLPSNSTSTSTTDTKNRNAFDTLMLDKFIALDQGKCQFMYQLITSMGATNVIEAGTSFGVSTIYLALAVSKVKNLTGKEGTVIATEKEESKAGVARGYWEQCGEMVSSQIDLRVGDLLETLNIDLPDKIDLLLLDIWSPLALPTLKTVQPHFRPGAVVLTDNTISGAKGYADLLAYMRDPSSGFRNMTLPFTNGFEMSVYMPSSSSA
ncbi:O-methyltransferase [Aspergillus stella-maris]|uniref:O-methyltransferase n=1 Tax=Aspergillus stella-maris TaxID=1810926 RepID=UPI003CCD295D